MAESVSASPDEIVLPLIEEELLVTKQLVNRERVTVSTKIDRREENASAELMEELIEIDRVPIDREVDAIPQVCDEGDLLIVPVVKEVLVKRLVLVEEVHLRRTRTSRHFEQPVTLRSTEFLIEREDLNKEKER